MRWPGKTNSGVTLPILQAKGTAFFYLPSLVLRAKNGGKFVRLFDQGDITGYESHSNANIAL